MEWLNNILHKWSSYHIRFSAIISIPLLIEPRCHGNIGSTPGLCGPCVSPYNNPSKSQAPLEQRSTREPIWTGESK